MPAPASSTRTSAPRHAPDPARGARRCRPHRPRCHTARGARRFRPLLLEARSANRNSNTTTSQPKRRRPARRQGRGGHRDLPHPTPAGWRRIASRVAVRDRRGVLPQSGVPARGRRPSRRQRPDRVPARRGTPPGRTRGSPRLRTGSLGAAADRGPRATGCLDPTRVARRLLHLEQRDDDHERNDERDDHCADVDDARGCCGGGCRVRLGRR